MKGLEYRYISDKDDANFLDDIQRDYPNILKQKPLLDSNWKKLEAVMSAGEYQQALMLADSIDLRYVASIFQYVLNQHIHPVKQWLRGAWYKNNHQISHLQSEMDYLEKDMAFWGWMKNGKDISSFGMYQEILDALKIDEEKVLLRNISLEKKRFVIDMEKGVVDVQKTEVSCYCESVLNPHLRLDMQMVLESVDKIDVSNALTYTDTYPDEENHEYIQRGILYFDITDLEDITLYTDKEPIVEIVGELSYVRENGQPLPLDQSAGATVRFKFPSEFTSELQLSSWK